MKLLWYQLNFQISLATMVISVDRKDTTTCLGTLDFPGGRSNIEHHVLKVVDNKIGPMIQYMD